MPTIWNVDDEFEGKGTASLCKVREEGIEQSEMIN